ncbi:hypothetical protein CRYUN_Cryun38cG0013600 [Craigia yunnanensis]
MVEHLQHYGVISSKKLAEVMATIDRALFVPDGTAAYVDSPMPGMHALDVGSGTGHLTACFAIMVRPQGRAIAPLLKEGSISVHADDGREGRPECAPYDAIHVGAAAPEIPQPLLD